MGWWNYEQNDEKMMKHVKTYRRYENPELFQALNQALGSCRLWEFHHGRWICWPRQPEQNRNGFARMELWLLDASGPKNRHIKQHRHGTTHQGTTQHGLSGRLWPKKCSNSPGASCCLMTSGVNWEAWGFGRSSWKFHIFMFFRQKKTRFSIIPSCPSCPTTGQL